MTSKRAKSAPLAVTLSSFWQDSFRDTGHLKGIYRATEILLGQVYRELLETALSASLDTTPVFGKEYFRELFFVESAREVKTGGVAYALDEDIVSFRYLQNRVTTPTKVLELGKDFSIESLDEGGYEIVFFGLAPHERDAVATVYVVQEPEIVLSGAYAAVEHGVPDEHLPTTEADLVAEVSARNDGRRTVAIDGVLFETSVAEVTVGVENEIKLPGGVFTSAAVVGKTLRGYHYTLGATVAEDRTVVGVASSDTLLIDVPYDALFDGQVKLLDTEVFRSEHAGFTLRLADAFEPLHGGDYVIEEVLDGTTVLLEGPIPFAETTATAISAVTRAGTTLTIPTGESFFTWRHVGQSVFVSDGTTYSGFLVIDSLASPDASGFFEEVTLSDPDDALSALGTTGLVMSVRVRDPSVSRGSWELRTPEVTRRAQMFAVDIDVEKNYLSTRYGQLVDIERPSSESYKQFLQGVMQYYWVGPTHFATRSALDTIAGFPVIERDGETLLRVTQYADKDEVVTDRRAYELPAGRVRADILEAGSGMTFRHLEALTEVFSVVDLQNTPTWMFGTVLPESVLPGEIEARRLVSPLIQLTTVGGSWKIGDPGVSIGTGVDGVVRDDDIIEFTDAVIAGTTVTVTSTKIIPAYLYKTVYIEGRRRRITAILSDSSFTIDSEIPELVGDDLTFSSSWVGNLLIALFLPSVPVYAFTTDFIGRDFDFTSDFFGISGSFTVTQVTPTYILVDHDYTPPTGGLITGHGGTVWVTVADALSGYIVNRPSMHYSLGHVVSQTMAGANMFGVRYEYGDDLLAVATLQQDIAEIIHSGRPAHTLFQNFPVRTLEDGVLVSDAVIEMTLAVDGENENDGMAILSRPLRVDGSWKIGELFTLPHGAFGWEKRLSFTEMSSLVTDFEDVDGNLLHEVLDARLATEVVVSLEADNTGELYTIDVYFFNGATWVFSESLLFDTDDLEILFVDAAGLYVTFLVSSSTGTEVALLLGTKRDEVVHRINPALNPSGTGSLSAGVDTLTVAGFEFYDVDIGRAVSLVIDVSGDSVLIRARIVARSSKTVVQLVDEDDNLPLSSPVTTSTAQWAFGPQKRWGQTPLVVGGQSLSLDPPFGASGGAGYGVELPIQLSVID